MKRLITTALAAALLLAPMARAQVTGMPATTASNPAPSATAGSATAPTSLSPGGCLVVTGNQAYAVGQQQELNCTLSGRLKVALSAAGNVDHAALLTTTLDSVLIGCKFYASAQTWADGDNGALRCAADGSLAAWLSNLPTTTPTGGVAQVVVGGGGADGAAPQVNSLPMAGVGADGFKHTVRTQNDGSAVVAGGTGALTQGKGVLDATTIRTSAADNDNPCTLSTTSSTLVGTAPNQGCTGASAGVIFTVDTTGYQSFSAVVPAWTGTLTYQWEGSNDPAATTWAAVQLLFSNGNQFTNSTANTGFNTWIGPLPPFRYLRARVTSYTSGSVTIYPAISSKPATQYSQLAGQVVGLNNASAALAASSANVGNLTPVTTYSAQTPGTATIVTGSHSLYAYNVVNTAASAVPVYLVISDLAANYGASGTAINAVTQKKCIGPIAAGQGLDVNFDTSPFSTSSGLTYGVSTSCTTYTTPSVEPVYVSIGYK